MPLLLTFVLGAVAGSFANVAIYRVPKNISLVAPRSSCPACGRQLTALENVPIFSYLIQGGRCRSCGEMISPRYPMVEILVAVMWVFTASRIGFAPELPAFLWFVTALIILSAIDLETKRLPNKILGPSSVAAAVLLAVAAVASQQLAQMGQAALGGLAYALPMLALAIAVPHGMGMGDVKFAGYIGLHLGWIGLGHVAVGAFAGFFIGALAGICLMAIGKQSRKQTIPFGPAMAVGAVVAIFAGKPILRAWLGSG